MNVAKRPRDASDGDADAQKKQKVADTTAPAPAPANQEDANPTKEEKCVEAIGTIAKELLCPITQELPIRPVTAEDGKIYEEKAIREWFGTKRMAKSPTTGADIGTKLVPVVQVRNNIESLIQTGAIEGELAEAWKQKLADETKVKECRAKAEGGGDGEAMWLLGAWYGSGEHGLAKDDVHARAWYERSAATRDPRGMASFGECLLGGWGGPKDNVFGIMNVTEAAGLGSDLGAMKLSRAFFNGNRGLPKDHVRARYWLKKVVDGECKYKHLKDTAIADAARMLRELDQ